MAYHLKQMSRTTWIVTRGREKAGFGRRLEDGQYLVKIGDQEPQRAAAILDAFGKAVEVANRIALCGENDHAKAVAALRERERESEQAVREDAAALNAGLGGTGLRVVVRHRTRKIRL